MFKVTPPKDFGEKYWQIIEIVSLNECYYHKSVCVEINCQEMFRNYFVILIEWKIGTVILIDYELVTALQMSKLTFYNIFTKIMNHYNF